MNITDILKGMDKARLEEAVRKAKEFAATEKGKEIMSQLREKGSIDGMLTESDKNNIMKELSQHPDIAKKISDILNGKD